MSVNYWAKPPEFLEERLDATPYARLEVHKRGISVSEETVSIRVGC